ncbi:Aftiphilin [Varanus komodoensis]|uniref:Aftiphilin n=1 Tax=Varanus komodoensis TaxID=61221 RepID=A0A8D2JGD3_VARKO|nr:aftiphilin isoform X2 [Varanus komodoensis]KAF7249425.1 Aftiphilin [Varanus komodoensis]
MEPDIIRMYSSSPPPLDNGADEEEEDEFGDFGGFSGAGSTSVGFDFASDYSSSKEEHKSSYNSNYSGNVDNIIALATVRFTNDKESITELPNSVKGPPDSSKEKCEFGSLGTSFDGVNSIEIKRTGKLESLCSEISRTDGKVPSQDQHVDSCNGEKQSSPEVLTNGFTAPDMANSQGVEDMDSISDSKGLRIISTQSTELSLDSIPSTEEDFADFAMFSNKQTTQVEETGNKICKNFNEREVLSVQENNVINRVGGEKSMKEEILDGSCENEEETCIEDEHICISKVNLLVSEDLYARKDCAALEHDYTVSSIQINVNSVGTTESIEGRGESDTENSKELDFCCTSDIANAFDLNVSRVQSHSSLPTEEKVYASEIVKNGESSTGHAPCSGLSEDDFGDFGTVSNGSLAFVDGAQAAAAQEHVQIPSENISETSDECGDFTDGSGAQQQSTKIAASQPNEIVNTVPEECQTPLTGYSMTLQPPTELENGDDSEFGDFGSVAKRFPDSDDFSDFSSAGCHQAAEWNAFEVDEKESCLWAVFEGEQVLDSYSRKDVWSSHRTGTTPGAETQMTDSVTSLHGTGSAQFQELPSSARTGLLSRLELIFETCFPSVPVSEIEEEITPLNLLLEAGHKPWGTEETLSERELLDVWTELQDIHDAYGLRYQWGGSHSNKKLLCSLGIDTRNILFTGNKKQPVIVPMYAAGLGMLEPTKEPLKPISAAEKIASIGQTPPVSPEMNICTSDQFQESLPPVQFDWSSSGLTNPLDGVDPELYELTTSKLETSNTTSKVTDAFAKLMSTVEKASTSTRKPKKDEQLSEEATKVISSLPDLSFMHAKVLMFPATLTPSTSCQGKVD